MSFKSKKQFESGNFNSWNTFAIQIMPRLVKDIKEQLMPTIDSTLESMLGPGAEGAKESLNLNVQCDEAGAIASASLSLVYAVEDFNVPTAPQTAIDQDTEAIRTVLENSNYTVADISIDAEKGKLSITLAVDLVEKQ